MKLRLGAARPPWEKSVMTGMMAQSASHSKRVGTHAVMVVEMMQRLVLQVPVNQSAIETAQ